MCGASIGMAWLRTWQGWDLAAVMAVPCDLTDTVGCGGTMWSGCWRGFVGAM